MVSSPEELVEAVRDIRSKKPFDSAQGENPVFRIFAGGSNIVFPDEGMDTLLICMRGGEIDTDGERVVADAGVELMGVIRVAISIGLSGLEMLSGIPGTIGGAVYGNAGAYGQSISDSVDRVEIYDVGADKVRWITERQCRFGYRTSAFKKKDWIILRIVLKLKKGDRKRLEKKSDEIVATREKKYKPGTRCPGSFFKNVLVKDVSKKTLGLVDRSKIIAGKIPTGYLLEEVGAKGMREGGVEIADFHGNLFINKGKGTARDVKALAKKLKKKVKDRFGIELEEEVRYF